VILDLSRLNRIVDFDERLAHVTIEPGVTMRQLFEYLEARGSNLMMSVTGSTPDSSLIGNIVERGIGVGLYGERFNHVCGLEVVLPSGDCVHTGFGRFSGAQTARVGRWGVGPWVDGLFTQSNLGIITQMTIWLSPKPRYFQAFLCCLNDDAGLEALVDRFQALRMDGTLRGTFTLWNDYKSFAALRQYPWAEAGGQTPVPPAVRAQLRKASRGGVWNAVGALYSASRAQGWADRRHIARVLRGQVDKLVFLDRIRVGVGRLLQRPFRWLTGIDLGQHLDTLYTRSLFLGFPSTLPLGSMYWRKKARVPADPDPDRDRCGVICCAPAVPFTGAHVRTATSIIEAAAAEFGFEPNLSLACVTERCLDIIVFILYDRDLAGEDERALACHDRMLQGLMRAGYYPYRLGVQSMHLLPPADDDSDCLHQVLKDALDPNHILAPGRYDCALTGLNHRTTI
jgi:4-cresol dehydrogenase (hydroxylating)